MRLKEVKEILLSLQGTSILHIIDKVVFIVSIYDIDIWHLLEIRMHLHKSHDFHCGEFPPLCQHGWELKEIPFDSMDNLFHYVVGSTNPLYIPNETYGDNGVSQILHRCFLYPYGDSCQCDYLNELMYRPVHIA